MITIFNGRSRGLGSEPTKKDIYVQVSVDLRKYLHLFKGAKLNVFLAIALHGDSQGWSKPSTRTLRRETGLSSDTIFKTLAELCELKVEGHRVLLRKGARRAGGQFSSNNYLIFPTEEEVAKFETPYLFAFDPQNEDEQGANVTISEKPGMAPVANKDPGGRAPPKHAGDLFRTSAKASLNSKFGLEDIRKYAWACDGIRNPDGWSIAAQRSGEADELIEEFLNERAKVRNDNLPPDPFEIACNAVELAMSVNQISLAEAIARLRDASSPIPGAPSAEAVLTWGKILAAVKSKHQTESFDTWLDLIRCEGIDGTHRVVFLWAPNRVVRDWVDAHYFIIGDAFGEIGLASYSVQWNATEEVHPALRELDEATVQRVINYYVAERGLKYEETDARAEVA